jgi:hypothetical protein
MQTAACILIDANLRLVQALRSYGECVGEENAQAMGGQAVQTQMSGPDRGVDLSTNEALQPQPAGSTAHSRKCSVYDAVVTGIELVGTSSHDESSARGVRIQFEVLNPPESAPFARTAEVYYQLSFKRRSKLREAVERLLRRPLTSAEIETEHWMHSILHKRHELSAYFGVAREAGKPLKYLHASLV